MHIDVKTRPAERVVHPKDRLFSGRVITLFSAALLGMILTASLPEQLQTALRQEASYIEMISALCLFITGVVFLFVRPFWAWAHISLLAFLLAEREFEPQVLTPDTVFSTVTHWIDEQFLHNKVVIGALAVWLLVGFARFTAPFMMDQIRRRTKAFALIALAVILAVSSQVFEAIGEGQSEASYWANAFLTWEELFELYFAASIMALAVVILKRAPRS